MIKDACVKLTQRNKVCVSPVWTVTSRSDTRVSLSKAAQHDVLLGLLSDPRHYPWVQRTLLELAEHS
ncbi:hypothetical protein E2C01_011499 [Portunus trituberculatus]|uniref:Uncharacterized protein n=1 Tax=Portunus trituberculatus TaxID=210409 RepID=A0A5B7DBC6_PORTR|nr:hypothetical protein [Portunus trituberculatus]